MKSILSIFLMLLLPISVLSQIESGLPEDIVNCIILIEKSVNDTLIPHGTGFLFYNYVHKNRYTVVTCAHILLNPIVYLKIPADTSLINFMKMNKLQTIPMGPDTWILLGKNLILPFKIQKNINCVINDSLDIGALNVGLLNKAQFQNDTTKIIFTNRKGIPKSLYGFKKDRKLGTDVFFLGFPFMIGTEYGYLGSYSEDISNPLVRSGSIAWTSIKSNEYLVDAFSYSGNSGSPIFTKNSITSSTYFIGMVLGHLPSPASDNMGLARCIWSDDIFNIVDKLNSFYKLK